MIKIEFSSEFNGSGVLYAPSASFEQSKWLGERGWYFYGQRSAPELAAKLRGAGVPVNTRWLPASKKATAAGILGAAGVEWSDAARAVVTASAAAQEASRATDAEIDIPTPEGLSYRPYQKAGVAFALAAFARGQKGVLLGHEMGLGKTMMAIGVMAKTDPRRTLVVCPASLRINWLREIEKWLPALRGSIAVIDGESVPAAPRVIVVNYDRVTGKSAKAAALRDALASEAWDLVVCDECHYLKNDKAQRTQFFFGAWERGKQNAPGIVDRAGRVLLMTGTPIQNRVRESIPLFRAIGALGADGVAKSEYAFLLRFCDPQVRWTGRRNVKTFDGATHLPELQSALRAGWMSRCLKADVEKELPPKIRSVLYLPCDDASLVLGAEEGERASREFERADVAGFAEAVAKLVGQKMGFEEVSHYRRRIAAAKAPYVIAHVRDLLDGDPARKVLVFGHHEGLLEALAFEFDELAIKITGSVDPSKRQALVDRFQTDPACRLAILSTHAAGVGLTLTAADHEVMAEPDWNPSWCQQAEDRAHRIGQTADKLPIDYLVLDGTLDAHVIRTMVGKMDVADRALDRRQDASAAPAAPPPPASKVGKAGGALVTISARGDDGVKHPETFEVTEDRRAAAREALLYLSGHCDGARSRDGVGFNGRDARSEFVQGLVAEAVAGPLEDKRAAWAILILRTYRDTQLAHLKLRLFPEDAP